MGRMRFDAKIVSLILRCISSPLHSVITNGSSNPRFKPSRGLRQRDPLSSFFFLICTERLSALMRLAKDDGTIRGVQARSMAHKSPTSYLQMIILCLGKPLFQEL